MPSWTRGLLLRRGPRLVDETPDGQKLMPKFVPRVRGCVSVSPYGYRTLFRGPHSGKLLLLTMTFRV